MNQATKATVMTAAMLLLIGGLSCLFTVQEGHSALMLRLGRLVRDAQGQPQNFGPGLHTKMPLLTRVMTFDTRLHTLDIKSSRIVTQEKKDVIVDYYVKWRIQHLADFYKTTGGNIFNAENLLEQLLNTSLRAEFGKRTIADVVSGERNDVMTILRQNADSNAGDLGIHVVDVRIKAVDLPSTTTSAIYKRMEANMNKIANGYRGQGRGKAAAIRGEADKVAAITLANANSMGMAIRAQGAAKAAKIYAAAYKLAPEFFAFYRSMMAYQTAFSHKEDVLILDQGAQFFDYFKHANPTKKRDVGGKS